MKSFTKSMQINYYENSGCVFISVIEHGSSAGWYAIDFKSKVNFYE